MSIEAQLERIAARLDALIDSKAGSAPCPSNDDIDPIYDRLRAARIAGVLYKMRRTRASCFDGALFGEPAWDMLLDLAFHAIDGRQVTVSDLSGAAGVPPTTALRWIGLLVERQLVERHPDPSDARRTFVALTQSAEIALNRHLLHCAAMIEALSQPVSLSGRVYC